MNKTIKVSVIVPVYKVEKYLNRCVKSIVKQTYTNLEIILVDDGSPDSCPEMCDEWAKKDSRIKVIHKKNGGLSDARNAGMEIITGEYVWFIDSDDYIELDAVEHIVNNAIKNNSDVVVFGMKKDSGHSITKINIQFDLLYRSNEEIKLKLLQRYYTNNNTLVYSVCNKFYNTNFIKDNSLFFDVKDIRCEDCWFNFKVFHIADIVSYIDKCYYCYFENTESITHDINNISYERWVNNRKRLLNDYFAKEIFIDYNEFYYQFQMNVIVYLKKLLVLNRMEDYNRIVRDVFLSNSTKYRNLLPKHFKFLSFMINKKMYRSFKSALLIWNMFKG